MKASRIFSIIGLFFAILWFGGSVLATTYGKVFPTGFLGPFAFVPLIIGAVLAKKERERDAARKAPPSNSSTNGR